MPGKAASDTPWINNTISVTNLGETENGALPPYTLNGNIDCYNRFVITKPELHSQLPPFLQTQSEVSRESCAIQTAFGFVDTSTSQVQLNYAEAAGSVTPYSGTAHIIGIPASISVLNFVNGAYAQIYRSLPASIEPTINATTHEVSYRLTQTPDFIVSDKAGHSLALSYDSISFSSNGEWMVVDAPGVALLRVNLATFTVDAIGQPFNYQTGTAPSPQTAITNDGRYVAAGSPSFGNLRVYDVSTCAATAITITSPAICQSRDLWEVLQKKVTGLKALSTVRFMDDNTLSLYASNQATAQAPLIIAKYNVSNDGAERAQLNYLSLGDSFSSGEGAYFYQTDTDDNINKCHLSTISFPLLLGKDLNLNRFQSVACSGAVMNDITTTAKTYTGQVTDKIPLLSRNSTDILSNFKPGYIGQLQFAEHYSPQNITVTISGNDIHFSEIIKDCIANFIRPTCYDTKEDRQELYSMIDKRQANLTALLSKLKRAAATKGHIYAVGYPSIVYPGGNCAVNVHLNKNELLLADDLVSRVNVMMKAAATSAGVSFIDVQNAFNGHRLCETISNNIAVNGLTIGNDIPAFTSGPIANESYHPNRLGQQLLMQAVKQGTQSLNLAMPIAKPTKLDTTGLDSSLAKLPTSGRSINKKVSTDAFVKKANAGSSVSAKVKGATAGVASNKTYSVAVNGKNTGSTRSNSDGDIDITIILPPTTINSYQTIEITGPTINNETVVIYQTIYVEGDHSANPPDCVLFAKAGIDDDRDGIDDACDGFIDNAPQLPDTPVITSTSQEPPTPTSQPPTSTLYTSATPKQSDTLVNTGQVATEHLAAPAPGAGPPRNTVRMENAYQTGQVLGNSTSRQVSNWPTTMVPNKRIKNFLPILITILTACIIVTTFGMLLHRYIKKHSC